MTGGKAPFETVVAEHGATVLRFARSRLGRDGAADVDDVWSETFLAALRAYPALPDDADLEAWLVVIARHKCVDAHRARSRRPVPSDDGVLASAVSRPNPTTALADRLDLAAAVATLPPKQRRTVVLHHLGGLPHAEVATLVGGTEAAARRACADGVRALGRLLDPTDPEGEPHD